MSKLKELIYKGNVSHGHLELDITPDELTERYNCPLVLNAANKNQYTGKEGFNKSKIKLRTVRTTDPIIRFTEFSSKQSRIGTTTSASNAGSTTLEHNGDVNVRKFDIFHFPEQNINVRVLDVSGNTLTIERPLGVKVAKPNNLTPAGVDSLDDVDIPAGAEFYNLGKVSPNSNRKEDSRVYNEVTERVATTQILRSDMDITDRRKAQEVNDRTKFTKLAERKKQELAELAITIEWFTLFGKMVFDSLGRVNDNTKSKSTGSTEEERYTASDGLFNVIQTEAPDNIVTPTGELGQTDSKVTPDMIGAFTKYKTTKVGMAPYLNLVGADVFESIGRIAAKQANSQLTVPYSEDKAYNKSVGRHIVTIITQFGPETFTYHPLLTGSKYGKLILSIPEDRISFGALKGSELKWVDQAQSDFSGDEGRFIADIGLIFAYAKEGFIVEGLDTTV